MELFFIWDLHFEIVYFRVLILNYLSTSFDYCLRRCSLVPLLVESMIYFIMFRYNIILAVLTIVSFDLDYKFYTSISL